MDLFHFQRSLPTLGMEPGARPKKSLIPQSTDVNTKNHDLNQRKLNIYKGQKFVYTIPEEFIQKWIDSGNLEKLFNDVVVIDWMQDVVNQWRIDPSAIDTSRVLVREAYFLSPEVIQASEDEGAYREGWLRMLNSVRRLSDYAGGFLNPEILIPYEVSPDKVKLERVIQSFDESFTSQP